MKKILSSPVLEMRSFVEEKFTWKKRSKPLLDTRPKFELIPFTSCMNVLISSYSDILMQIFHSLCLYISSLYKNT